MRSRSALAWTARSVAVGLEVGLHAGFGGGNLDPHAVALAGQAVECQGQALGLLAPPDELVVLHAARARPEADDATALAIHLALEFLLPEIQLALQLAGIGGCRLEFLVHPGQIGPQWLGRLGDRLIERGLRRGLGLGIRAGAGQVAPGDETGLECLVPTVAHFRHGRFYSGDRRAHAVLARLALGAHGIDFLLPVILDLGADGVFEEQQRERVGNGQAHQHGHHHPQGKLAGLAQERLVRPVARQQCPVDGHDDEGPGQRHRINDPRVVGQRRERVGARDEGEYRGHQHRGTERHIFPLFPVRTGFQSFAARGGQPEKEPFEAEGGRIHDR